MLAGWYSLGGGNALNAGTPQVLLDQFIQESQFFRQGVYPIVYVYVDCDWRWQGQIRSNLHGGAKAYRYGTGVTTATHIVKGLTEKATNPHRSN